MAISKMANGFYTFPDNHFKSMNKKELLMYIRTIEKNWENALITNEIQYNNCKKLLAEERNKAIDEFAERVIAKYEELPTTLGYTEEIVKEIAEQMKSGIV